YTTLFRSRRRSGAFVPISKQLVHDDRAVLDDGPDLLAVDALGGRRGAVANRRAIVSIGTPLSDSSDTKLCRRSLGVHSARADAGLRVDLAIALRQRGDVVASKQQAPRAAEPGRCVSAVGQPSCLPPDLLAQSIQSHQKSYQRARIFDFSFRDEASNPIQGNPFKFSLILLGRIADVFGPATKKHIMRVSKHADGGLECN